jgi:hypothetical protein
VSGNSEKHRPASLGEFLFAELRSAIQDVRQKLVEEGWFGRVVTPAPVTDAAREQGAPPPHDWGSDRPTLGELMAQRASSPGREPSREQHAQDLER